MSDVAPNGTTMLPLRERDRWEAVNDGKEGYRRVVCGVELRLWNSYFDREYGHVHYIARVAPDGSPLEPESGWGGMFGTVHEALVLAWQLESIIKYQHETGAPVQ